MPKSRPLAIRFAIGFGLVALFWLVSAVVPSPARFALWAIGFVIDFGTPLTLGRLNAEFPLNSGHLQERFGNFTLIVMSEGIVGVVDGLRDFSWTPGAGVIVALAFGVAVLGGQLSALAVFAIVGLASVAQIGIELWYRSQAPVPRQSHGNSG